MVKTKIEVPPTLKTEESSADADADNFEQRRRFLTTKHLDLLQEQLDLPEKISSILLKLKDHAMDTKEGDRLRAELEELEKRNRTIYLSIQENLEELKKHNPDLFNILRPTEEAKKSLKKAA